MGIDIVKAEADPNPASSGDAVKITVTIRRGRSMQRAAGEQPGQRDGALSWRADEGRWWPIHLRALIRDEGEQAPRSDAERDL